MEDEAKNAADFEEAPSEGVLGAMEVDRTWIHELCGGAWMFGSDPGVPAPPARKIFHVEECATSGCQSKWNPICGRDIRLSSSLLRPLQLLVEEFSHVIVADSGSSSQLLKHRLYLCWDAGQLVVSKVFHLVHIFFIEWRHADLFVPQFLEEQLKQSPTRGWHTSGNNARSPNEDNRANMSCDSRGFWWL
jgi:hypothetical protein